MEICLGMIRMSPNDFWNLSPREMYASIAGFLEFNTTSQEEPLTKDELDDLMELYPD